MLETRNGLQLRDSDVQVVRESIVDAFTTEYAGKLRPPDFVVVKVTSVSETDTKFEFKGELSTAVTTVSLNALQSWNFTSNETRRKSRNGTTTLSASIGTRIL